MVVRRLVDRTTRGLAGTPLLGKRRYRLGCFTLGGLKRLDPAEPVCHVSYYEADAFARWAGCRLPTEDEWELATTEIGLVHRFDLDRAHPRPMGVEATGAAGQVWEWTASAYLPYPGFRPSAGAVGEYNGKFMVNQHALRGGCVASPPGHPRVTYRNFFAPHCRWPFSGLRLAHARAMRHLAACPDAGFLRSLVGPDDDVDRASAASAMDGTDELSERELAALRLLWTRLSLREIGNELYVSLNTGR